MKTETLRKKLLHFGVQFKKLLVINGSSLLRSDRIGVILRNQIWQNFSSCLIIWQILNEKRPKFTPISELFFNIDKYL